ncbi:MAG: polysaccharide deacetylase family protein [Bacteroidia bacterium]|nr:polysaccharide deacetylase family protein [Bacteroidia bacterium]
MLPEITVRIDLPSDFRRGARHALFHLALIAGFRPRFIGHADADITYAAERPATGVWLPADTALHARLLDRRATGAELQRIPAFGEQWHILFPIAVDHTIPFDLPAASLFFLGLHEQWCSESRDAFGRYPASQSLLGKHNMLGVPVASSWGRLLRMVLRQAGFNLPDGPGFRGKSHAVCMTHDIDYLSKYTPGLLFREIVKNFLFNRRHVPAGERLRRLREYIGFGFSGRDPYRESIRRMLEAERAAGMKASWLFKAGGNDKRDVTYNIRGAAAAEALRGIREDGHDIGIHPSFNAHTDATMFGREMQRLAEVLGISPRTVRQHYLRFEYPATWRIQVENGCEVDSTLGFAEQEGFRNGFCHPFLPFDFERGEALPIWEVPLTVMDGTLAGYRELDTVASLQRIRDMHSAVRAENGVLVLLFHNTVFDLHDFPGWGEVFHEVCTDIRTSPDVFATDLSSLGKHWCETAGYSNPGEIRQVINTEPV